MLPPCSTCRFFVAAPPEATDPRGECRRHAPWPAAWLAGPVRSTSDAQARWPLTLETDGCGEHQPLPLAQGGCAECAELRRMIDGMAERIHAQAQLLERRAAK